MSTPAWVGVTGTNGKTTTVAMLGDVLVAAGLNPLVVHTLGTFLRGEPLPHDQTEAGFLRAVEQAGRDGARAGVVECTSEALAAGFATRLPWQVAVYTPITRDHLDAHPSLEHYAAAKAQLARNVAPGGTVVFPADDEVCGHLRQVVPAGVEIVEAALAGEPTVELEGTRFSVAGLEAGPLRVPYVGRAFAENAAGVLMAARALGISLDTIARALADHVPLPGRFQVVGRNPVVVVDYAHNPDGLRRALATARAVCEGAVHLVFGAGGERDRDKRPAMGAAAAAADRVTLTSDNARSESPAAIAEEIRSGIPDGPRVDTIVDRRAAIETAIRAAAREDLVLLAGRGPEPTLDLGGDPLELSDAEVARAAWTRREG